MNPRFRIVVSIVALLAAFLLATAWFAGHSRSTAADTFRVFIDADTTNGICNLPEDSSLSVSVGDSFSVAVCVEDPPAALGAFSFHVVYDDTVIRAPEVADTGAGLDDNPDANQAALGDGWDCSALGVAFPMGDGDPASGPGGGLATLNCMNLPGPFTFASTGYLALVNFQTQGVAGTSALTLAQVLLNDSVATELGTCNPTVVSPVPCVDGSVSVGGAPVATSTPVVPPGTTPAVTPATTPGATPTPAPTPPPGQAQSVELAAGCNPVASTYPNGTTVQTLAAAISPPDILNAMWAFQGGLWLGYSPAYPEASNLVTRDFLDVVFLCVDAPGTFVRPLV
jgi:hypothetical protein